VSETRFAHVLEEARREGRAVGAFTCYDLAGLEAVARAAEARGAPAIVLVSPGSFTSPGGPRLVRAFRAAAEEASVPLLVQLDHVSEPGVIEAAARAGVHAVMADGSRLPYEENLAFSAAMVRSLHRHGVGVEAELGRVEGHEDEAREVVSGEMTDPEQATAFRAASGVDCLAVAIGNVHGHYSGPPELDWGRLDLIRGGDGEPLSLHGASGLPEPMLRRAVDLGIAKVNVNTELRAAYFGTLEQEVRPRSRTLDLKGLGDRVVERVSAVVDEKLETLGWSRRGAP
jgi:tagatose 1,6-diphosphate aldolase GatY/KbaY